jgi:hypothetical protein
MGRAAVAGARAAQILALRAASQTVLEPSARAAVESVERSLREELGPSIPKRRAAQLLGVSVTALDRWIARGAIPVVRVEGSSRQEVDSAEVLRLAELARDGGGFASAVRRLAERRERERWIVEAAELSTALTTIAAAFGR